MGGAVLVQQGPRELMGDENVLSLSPQRQQTKDVFVKSHQTAHFERVNFTVGKLYLNLKHS